MEIWKDVKDYKWLYEVSNLGKVKSMNYNHTWKEQVLKSWMSIHWYEIVSLCTKGKSKTCTVHRLVWIEFIPNPENKPQINHINWRKTDNRVENLEWVTRSENVKHAYTTWLKKSTDNNVFVTNNPNKWRFWKNSKHSRIVYQYSIDLKFIKKWESIMDIQRELWMFNQNIIACCRWRAKTAWWYKWSYQRS